MSVYKSSNCALAQVQHLPERKRASWRREDFSADGPHYALDFVRHKPILVGWLQLFTLCRIIVIIFLVSVSTLQRFVLFSTACSTSHLLESSWSHLVPFAFKRRLGVSDLYSCANLQCQRRSKRDCNLRKASPATKSFDCSAFRWRDL